MLSRIKFFLRSLIQLVATLAFVAPSFAQQRPPATEVAGIAVNYDESKVGTYTLPDVLTMSNGTKVRDANTWLKKRRPEILHLYEENQFGKMPGRPAGMSFNVFDKGTPVFGGQAIRKQITIYFSKDTSAHKVQVLMYLPANSAKPSPLLLVANFSANSYATTDSSVGTSLTWTKEGKRVPVVGGRSFGKL